MKVFYVKIIESKIFNFFEQQWWLGILIGFIATLCTFPPNSVNPYQINGTIARVYDKEIWTRVTGKGSSKKVCKIVVLSDSSYYSTNDEKAKKYLSSTDLTGKKAKIVFFNFRNNNNDDNAINKLEIDGKIIYDQNIWLVSLFWFCLIWVVWGGFGEIVRIWKSV